MSNNKQLSSVEWFLDKLIEHQIIKIGQTTYGGKVNYKHEILFEQAKAMHNEEIEKAHARGEVTGFGRVNHPKFYEDKTPEQYYNETFGGNNE